MSQNPESPAFGYATISVTHRAIHRERAETLGARPGRRRTKPECLSIGHAWTEDAARDDGQICIVCQVVRLG